MALPKLLPHTKLARRPCRVFFGHNVRTNTTGRNKPANKQQQQQPSSSAASKSSSNEKSPPKSRLPLPTSPKQKKSKNNPPVAPYQEPPILTPGPPAAHDPSSQQPPPPHYLFHQSPHSTRGGGSYRGGYILPTVNVAALLDPLTYCRKSAFFGGRSPTRHGTEAARRLIQGKKKVLQVLGDQVRQRKTQRPLSYAVVGHGVPPQLLQDHINMAESLLRHHDGAAECSFHNFQGGLEFDWMRVRRRDGSTKAFPWPPPPPTNARHPHHDWEQQMSLYLTVMNRMASTLGLVLSSTSEPDLNDDETSSARTHKEGKKQDDDDDDDFVAASPSSPSLHQPPPPRRWNADLLLGTAYPPHLLPRPEGYEGPLPIVEWTPRSGSEGPGCVCIRLQGAASSNDHPRQASTTTSSSLRRKKRVPITLVFDACFRNEEEGQDE